MLQLFYYILKGHRKPKVSEYQQKSHIRLLPSTDSAEIEAGYQLEYFYGTFTYIPIKHQQNRPTLPEHYPRFLVGFLFLDL